MAGVILISSIAGSAVTVSATGTGRVAQTKATQKVKWSSGPNKKKLSCDAAVVMELSTGLVLYQKNAHKQHYPASITKILTAMLTAENCANNEVVTFSETAAYGIEAGSSTVFTEPGEKLTIEECLYAIMLQSANEVCLGVGEHISGSIEGFVDLMNQRVKELGLKNTHFNNPNGLPDPKHYTTAYDMAVISREAMKNQIFRKVTATRRYYMPKTNKHKMVRIWDNHHQMINGYSWPKYEYKYCIGGKTGYTMAARNTLVTYAEKDGMELVCVVMRANGPKEGEPNEYTDTISLLNFGFEKYQKYAVNEAGNDINEDLFNNYDSYFDTEDSPIHLSGESSVVLPKGVDISAAKQKVTYKENVALVEGDNIIGHVTYTYGDKTVGSTDILYTKTADDMTNHLDAASREIVDSEIQELEDSEQKDKKKANVWRKVKNTVVGFFKIRAVQIILLVLLAAIAIYFLIYFLRHVELPKFGKHRRRRRSMSGYRSKQGRRNARRIERERRRNSSGYKTTRHNVSKHYEKRRTPREEKKRRSRGVRYHKNHKRTRESFGKNFFDF